MTFEFFTNQMRRLNSQWKNSYGEERTKRLWTIWKNCEESLFAEIVDRGLDTYRAAPLTDDFAKLEQEVRNQRAKFRDYDGLTGGGFGQVLESAHKFAKYDDLSVRDRNKARIKLLNDFATGRITKKQFVQGCDFYDKAAGLSIDVVNRGMWNDGKDYIEWAKGTT